jgi:erythromycin esterase
MHKRSIPSRSALAAMAISIVACASGAPKSPPSPAPIASSTSAPLDAKLAAVEGVVLAEDGRPVDGALVALLPPDTPAEAAREASHDGGRFKLAVRKPGKYAITATIPGHTAAYVEPFELREGETRGGVSVKLGGAGITLAGKALDPKGKPLVGTMVRAARFSDKQGDIFVVQPDAEGAFRVTVPKAPYMLFASAPRYEGTLNVPEARQDLAITLARAFPMDEPAPAEAAAWTRASAARLATVEAGHGFADMKEIGRMVGGARVVSLGEATHGSREFFQLKHRMLEYLVTERGFDVFAIEASFPEALVVNDYVLHGKGDPADAVAGMEFWTWDTEEVLALVQWMRRYNEDPKHPNKLRFYGFDMQSPTASVQAVSAYLKQVDPKAAAKHAGALGALDDAYSTAVLTSRSEQAQKAAEKGLAAIVTWMEAHQAEYVKKSSERAFKLARLHARVAHQGVVQMIGPWTGGHRDGAMAENALALLDLDGPKAKMVLWAHNQHVARTFGDPTFVPMGGHLHRALGKDLVTFGFAFDRGSFQAMELPFRGGRGLMSFTAPPAPAGSLDATLAAAGPPIFALDLRLAPPKSAAREWLDAKLFTRSIGSGYSSSDPRAFFMAMSPREAYDALLFVASTTTARAKPTTNRGGATPPPAPHAFMNGTFEADANGAAPDGWYAPSHMPRVGYRVAASDTRPHQGKRCGMIARDASPWPNAASSLSQRVDAAPYRGKHVRLRAAVRAEVRGIGNEAHLYLKVTGGRRPPALASTIDQPIVGRAWQTRELEIDVPADAQVIALGLSLAGRGRAFLDDVSLTIVR